MCLSGNSVTLPNSQALVLTGLIRDLPGQNGRFVPPSLVIAFLVCGFDSTLEEYPLDRGGEPAADTFIQAIATDEVKAVRFAKTTETINRAVEAVYQNAWSFRGEPQVGIRG